jgi:hypothetical protein
VTDGGKSGFVNPPGEGYAPAPSGTGPAAGPQRPRHINARSDARRHMLLIAMGVALGVVVLGAAAAVKGSVGHDPPAEPQAATASSAPVTSVPATSAPANTEAADKGLCEAIAPLMREASDSKTAFVNLGRAGTSQRDAAIPQFQTAIRDWADRAQKAFDENAGPPRYLTRMVQRYIDDVREYAASIRPGPATDADAAALDDSVVALGGAVEVCPAVGVQW